MSDNEVGAEVVSHREYRTPLNGWRTFLAVWITQSISAFGSNLTFFSLTIWITTVLYPRPDQKQALGVALSAVSLAFTLTVIFGGPIAGAWADRHDRRRTMMAMDFASGALSLTLVGLIGTDALNLPLLLLVSVLFAAAGAFHGSSFEASYAMIVPDQLLPRANGMMQTTLALSGVLSPAVAAAILSLPGLARQGHIPGSLGTVLGRMANGMPIAIAIDSMTFFAAALTLLALRIPSPARTELRSNDGRVKKTMWEDIREGALYIFRRRPLLWLLSMLALLNLISAPVNVLFPLLIKFNLATDWSRRGFTFETALALVSTMASVGGVIGGLIVSSWGGLKRHRIYGVFVPMVAGGLFQVVLGFSPYLFLSSSVLAAASLLAPFAGAHSQTIWQAQTPRELQGRVFSVRRLIAQVTVPFGVAMGGWLAGAFNPGTVIAVSGVTVTVFSVLQFFNPQLVRVEDKELLDQMAEKAQL